jgi:hypothetical protein
VLPGNPLPAQIRFQVEPNGYGERILPHSVVEYFIKNADGTLSFLTEGSTQPVSSRVDARRHRARRQILLPDRLTPGSPERVAQTVVHASICKTRRFRFNLQPPRVAADDADGEAVKVLDGHDISAAVLARKLDGMAHWHLLMSRLSARISASSRLPIRQIANSSRVSSRLSSPISCGHARPRRRQHNVPDSPRADEPPHRGAHRAVP